MQGEIKAGEIQEYESSTSEDTVVVLKRITFWDKYAIWLLTGSLVIVSGGILGVYAMRRRKVGQEVVPERNREYAPRFCLECGKPLRRGSKYCLVCGTPTRRRSALF
jgi:hypothetical protein